MKALRILHINTTDGRGGAAQLVSDLREASQTLGHSSQLAVGWKTSQKPDVFKIASNPGRSVWSRIVQRLSESHVWIRRLLRPLRLARVLFGQEDFDFPATRRILQELLHRTDVLHLHNLHGGYFDLRILPELSNRVPTIVTLHDAWMLAGHCSHSFNCTRWQIGCGRCPDLTIYPAVRHDSTAYNWKRKSRIYAKSALHVVAPSEDLLRKARISILAHAFLSSQVIPNGIDLSTFKPGSKRQCRIELGLPLNATILLFAANGIRHNIWKDYRTMRRAFELLGGPVRKQGELLFIGIGEEASQKAVGGNCLRLIPFSHDRTLLAKYYQASDLYVHGARAETWGLSITEAMACGLPVVATAVGGIPDQIVHDRTGFLVPVGDAEQMSARIQQLLQDAGLRQEIGGHARHRVEARFGRLRMAKSYLNLYKEAIARTANH